MVGLTRDQWHRYRWMDGPIMPGVTSVSGMLDKSGPLMGWARRETAAYVVENIDLVTRMVQDFGPDGTAAAVKTVTVKANTAAKKRGTNVHQQIEKVLRELHDGRPITVRPDEETLPYMNAFWQVHNRYQLKYLTVEAMVCSLTHGYGGTLDAIAVDRDGARVLIDWKTGTRVVPSMRLQLAALTRADFIGRAGTDTKYAIPSIDRHAIGHLTPEGGDLVYQDVVDDDFGAFLACIPLWHWKQKYDNEDKWRKAA